MRTLVRALAFHHGYYVTVVCPLDKSETYYDPHLFGWICLKCRGRYWLV